MEYNKEDAIKLLHLSETRFILNDKKGALALAQKAKRLYPALKNIQQAIASYEVLLEASKPGPTDWHAVLRVHPSADYPAIKKQFQKMCLLTHPDKNRSSAADGAFKMVMKALMKRVKQVGSACMWAQLMPMARALSWNRFS